MKKNLLLLGIATALSLGVNAQNSARSVTVKGPKVPAKMVAPSNFKGDEVVNYNAPIKHNNNIPSILAGTTIGTTFYDLQTNGIPGRRIINHGNGKLTGLWTYGDTPTTYPERGTGYAYFDGTNWSAKPTARIENIRAGWPYEVTLDIGGVKSEMIFSHNAAASAAKNPALMATTNTTIGGTSFTTKASRAGYDVADSVGTIWNRAAIGSNNTIHVMSCFSESIKGNSPDSIIINGITRPVVYSRSTDGGATWIQNATLLPGYSAPRYKIGSADQYDIDANGTNVAIVMADDLNDLVFWKSTTNGATAFKKTTIDSVELQITAVPLDSNLRVPANDGTASVVVANDGTAHVVYANDLMFRLDPAGAPTSINFSQGTTLVYWNDKDKVRMEIPLVDADILTGPSGNNKYDLGSAAYAGYRYGNNGNITQPGLSLGTDGKIYVVYSQCMDEDTTVDGQPFRDLFVISSNDNGAHWSNPVNITKSTGKEDVYPSIAKFSDATSAHILWQQDAEPGNALQDMDTPDENNIQYLKFDLGQITSWPRTAKPYSNKPYTIGIESVAKLDFSVSQNYPNPFSESTTINVNLTKNSTVALTVTNVLGQTVFVDNAKNVSGNYSFKVDKATIGTGIFFYTVNVNGQTITKKMIVE
jgi:hypothetical protein